jgi:hypothetical protein
MPAYWRGAIEGTPWGWAGGLTPTNVAEQLKKIEPIIHVKDVEEVQWNQPYKLVPQNKHWIDAETHLRSFKHQNGSELVQDVFDLDKVRQFLEAAKPWVIGQPEKP